MPSVPEEEDIHGVEDDSYTSGDDEGTWIEWFCRLKGNELFCQVDPAYIEDQFNLTGLRSKVSRYEDALDMILDVDPQEPLSENAQEAIEDVAEQLYGLIHARYIITAQGLQAMLQLYQNKKFGTCPRVLCRSPRLLPVGQSDMKDEYPVRMYCHRCEELYSCKPKYKHIDGAYFGTTFPHLFFLTFPELKVFTEPVEAYIPRVFGYKISPIAYQKSLEATEAKKQESSKSRSQTQAWAANTTTNTKPTSATAAKPDNNNSSVTPAPPTNTK